MNTTPHPSPRHASSRPPPRCECGAPRRTRTRSPPVLPACRHRSAPQPLQQRLRGARPARQVGHRGGSPNGDRRPPASRVARGVQGGLNEAHEGALRPADAVPPHVLESRLLSREPRELAQLVLRRGYLWVQRLPTSLGVAAHGAGRRGARARASARWIGPVNPCPRTGIRRTGTAARCHRAGTHCTGPGIPCFIRSLTHQNSRHGHVRLKLQAGQSGGHRHRAGRRRVRRAN